MTHDDSQLPPRRPPTGEPQPDGVQRAFDQARRLGLRRSADDRWVAGVCAGLADRLGVDPLVVRVATVVLVLLGGLGATLYGLAWLFLPDANSRIEAEASARGDVRPAAVTAVVLVLVGLALPEPWRGGPPWLAGLGGFVGFLVVATLAVGAVVLLSGDRADRVPGGYAPPTHGTPGQYGSTGQYGATASATAPTVGVAGPAGSEPAAAGGTPWTVPVPAPRPPTRRGPGTAGTLAAVGLALVAAGAVAAAEDTGSFEGGTVPLAAAAGLAVLGTAVLLLGLAGRRDGAVGGLAFLAAVVAVIAASVPDGMPDQLAGEVDWRPQNEMRAAAGYALGAGSATVDLTELEPSGEDILVPVRTGVGTTRIEVPADVPVQVRARLLIGSLGRSPAELPPGWRLSGQLSGFGTDALLSSPGRGGPRLVIDVRGAIGAVDVVEVTR